MIRRFRLLALLPLTIGLVAFTLPLPQGGGERQGGGRPGGERHEPSVLGQQMEEINGALRAVARRPRGSGASPELLEALARAEKAILVAKGEVPPLFAREDDAATEAAELVAFRKGLNDLLRGFLDLEDALVADDAAEVESSMKKLVERRDAGHERFAPKRGGR